MIILISYLLEYTLPSYPADPYADIGDEIFNIFNSLEYRQCSFIRLRLNYCGQITVNGFCSLIEVFIVTKKLSYIIFLSYS